MVDGMAVLAFIASLAVVGAMVLHIKRKFASASLDSAGEERALVTIYT